eukprot:scaffold2469_cov149-Skeletonema_menzelii.AAC.4
MQIDKKYPLPASMSLDSNHRVPYLPKISLSLLLQVTGLALRRDVPSRDVSSTPVLSGSDVWRDDWSFPMTYYNRGYGSSRRYGRGGYGMGGYGGYGMDGYGYGGGYGGYGMGGYGGYGGGYGGYGYGGGYGGYGRGYGGYGLGYSNMNNFPETREWRARRSMDMEATEDMEDTTAEAATINKSTNHHTPEWMESQ